MPLHRFYKLDMKLSLKDNFYRKTIVEYPQLFLLIQGFYASKSMSDIENEKVETKKPKLIDYLQLREESEEKEDNAEDVVMESESSNSSSEDDNDDDLLVEKLLPSYRDLITTP